MAHWEVSGVAEVFVTIRVQAETAEEAMTQAESMPMRKWSVDGFVNGLEEVDGVEEIHDA